MNKIIKGFSILLFLVAMPIDAEEVTQSNNTADDIKDQLREKQDRIMQLEIEVLELKLQNEKEKVVELQAETRALKEQNEKKSRSDAEKTATEKTPLKEQNKESVVDDTPRNIDKKVAQTFPEPDTINGKFKIRFGASYLYDNEFIVEERFAGGVDFNEGKMVAKKTTEASLEIQSPHLYFTSRSKFGLLFSSGYQRFDLDKQEINYTDYDNGTIVDFGTRTEGEQVYLTPIIFMNPLRNASVNQSLVIGFGLGLSYIRAQGATRITEPFYSATNEPDQTQNYNISETGVVFKLLVDYQWKNLFAGLFIQSSIVEESSDYYIYTSSGVNAGISFNL